MNVSADMKLAIAKLTMGGWEGDIKKVKKVYIFPTFEDAFAFMARCVPEISKRDHHPEWTNVYNKVTVELSTHDKGGVTNKDIELAETMDGLARLLKAKS